jgi:hypothetical protein
MAKRIIDTFFAAGRFDPRWRAEASTQLQLHLGRTPKGVQVVRAVTPPVGPSSSNGPPGPPAAGSPTRLPDEQTDPSARHIEGGSEAGAYPGPVNDVSDTFNPELVREACQYALEQITKDIDDNGWTISGFADLNDHVEADEYIVDACDHVGVNAAGDAPFVDTVIEWLDDALETRYADGRTT